MYMCECGEQFEDINEEARRHILDQHLDIVETRFEDFLDDANEHNDDVSDDELYDEAVDDVVDELLDEIIDDIED